MLKINCKGKRTVGKTNKGINVENNNSLQKLKLNIQRREKKNKGRRKKKGKKGKTPQNYKSPMQMQRFITIKSVAEYTYTLINKIKTKVQQK